METPIDKLKVMNEKPRGRKKQIEQSPQIEALVKKLYNANMSETQIAEGVSEAFERKFTPPAVAYYKKKLRKKGEIV